MTTTLDPFVPIDPNLEFNDQASNVVNTVIAALLRAFNPNDAVMAPLGGGSETVHFVAGDVVALELWDAHTNQTDCDEPFLWVRMTRRYRFTHFPTAETGEVNCTMPRAVSLEVGVGRCSQLSPEVDWSVMQTESEVSLDDSFRIELALCEAVRTLQKGQDRLVAIGEITPFGPEGGVVAWSATLHVKL
jgi:hypothetical protein